MIGDDDYLPDRFAALERGVITESEWRQIDRAHRFVVNVERGAKGDS